MYRYTHADRDFVKARAAQFRDQTQRYLAGTLSEDEYRPLRLMNGLYLQRHNPMLRIAIPYGLLESRQLRQLAYIARRFDREFGHFTTRQNIQFNWIQLAEVPDLLDALAEVDMHAIQTSGNCIRNVTTDHLAGIAADERLDPRPYCELIRQWSSLHPEFSYLPRKFKIAVTGSPKDRAASQVHDIGLHVVEQEGKIGFEVFVGGGLGRTPVIGKALRAFVPESEILNYLEAILRIYNEQGRRDNKYKARIKILVNSLKIDEFRTQVEAEWQQIRLGAPPFPYETLARIQADFAPFTYEAAAANDLSGHEKLQHNPLFNRWFKQNTVAHKVPGYRGVFVALKNPSGATGDMTADQMDAVADLADQFSFGMIRSTHDQNLLLADVRQGDLFEVWKALEKLQLAVPNLRTLADAICCPGFDYCSLANARSIPLVQNLQERFSDLDYLYDLGEIQLNVSGCMNGCGHHSVGHIGILGVEKHGEEWYQITLGGSSKENAALGQVLGPSVAYENMVETIEKILTVYVEHRELDEPFLQTVQRIGLTPFKERVYANH